MPADDSRTPLCPVRLSVFSVMDHYPDRDRSIAEFYRQVLEQCQLADSLGYDSFWVAEHHFHEYGVVTNPALFLAAAAACTTRIKLGPAIAVLPFRDPLLCAEDYASLDLISGGRLIMGVGSGYLAHEFAGFGVEGKDKRERFDEALSVIRGLWTGATMDFAGKFSRVNKVALNVTPLQRPAPPIFVAALRPEACYHIGRQGHGLMVVPYASVDERLEIANMIEDYQRGAAEGGHGQTPGVLVALHAHVAESDRAARDAALAAFNRYRDTRLYAKSHKSYDEVITAGLGLFGAVETVVEQLAQMHALGVGHVLLLKNFGALDHHQVVTSMRRFAGEVRPRLAARLVSAT